MEWTHTSCKQWSRCTRTLQKTPAGALSVYYHRVSDSGIGPQSGTRRRNIFEYSIHKGVPFSKFLSGVTEAFNSALDERKTQIADEVNEIYDMILKDFDLIFVVKEIDDPMMDELRHKPRSL